MDYHGSSYARFLHWQEPIAFEVPVMTGTSSLSSSRACAVVLVLIDSFASFQFFRESRKNCQYLVEPVKIQPSVLCMSILASPERTCVVAVSGQSSTNSARSRGKYRTMLLETAIFFLFSFNSKTSHGASSLHRIDARFPLCCCPKRINLSRTSVDGSIYAIVIIIFVDEGCIG